MTEGPEIEIVFDTAEGLEQGKTKVKYRNVEMGLVESIRLDDDFDSVIATVKMDRQTLPLLREDTRFWVVTARVGLGNISGLDTLLSGAYIQFAPGTGPDGARRFVALSEPPLTPTGAPGLRLQLVSKLSSSVSSGDQVVYQGHNVGRVEKAEFDPEAAESRFVIFIDAPYHELVNTSTRFWDASGISVSAGADGLKIDTASLDTILLGGVSFGVPPGIEAGKPVENNAEFRLYDSLEDTVANPFQFGAYLVAAFSQSVKGLLPGAPVEYRGIKLGRVERILLKEATTINLSRGERATGDAIPVLMYIEPGRVGMPDSPASVERLLQNLHSGVPQGLRATLETGNLLTGAKLITIDYYDDLEPQEVGKFLDYPEVPTLDTGLEQIEQRINAILDKVAGLPLDDTVAAANEALASLDETLRGLNEMIESDGMQNLPDQLDRTLSDLQRALDGLAPGSEVYQSINSSLLRLNRTLGNLEAMSDTLATQPNAIVLPAGTSPDPTPEARK
jgi:paraquat-inducible protein B